MPVCLLVGLHTYLIFCLSLSLLNLFHLVICGSQFLRPMVLLYIHQSTKSKGLSTQHFRQSNYKHHLTQKEGFLVHPDICHSILHISWLLLFNGTDPHQPETAVADARVSLEDFPGISIKCRAANFCNSNCKFVVGIIIVSPTPTLSLSTPYYCYSPDVQF